jgi:small subunit ribosomal protein S17e
LNRVRRLAEDLVNRHPALFGGDFDKNKQALSQVAVIRTRSLRNQLAGAITKLMHERTIIATTNQVPAATIEERIEAERPKEDRKSVSENRLQGDKESGSISSNQDSESKPETMQESTTVIQ